ncbi:rhomboid-related protein 3 isoform X3 [Meriones unguiculatus]|uniref:rhomboid-related protein 3 isoform X3 n=1 Tax=Meriones unguiculatus TaxID=10047 RepID=UPI00293F33F0|nr:rhomboid-related protein 3 isoform X3 [Meriones unguiculatus]
MGEHPSPGPAVAACAEAERIEELEPEADERPPAAPEDHWKVLFEKFDPGSTGYISTGKFRSLLESHSSKLDPHKKEVLLALADSHADGQICYQDFVNLMSNKRSNSFRQAILQGNRRLSSKALLEEKGLSLSQRLIRHVAYETLPREIDRKWYYDSYTCCPPPWFMITVTLLEVTLFLYNGVLLDQFVLQVTHPRYLKNSLVYHPQLRAQAWRYLTYIFMHAGVEQLGLNVALQLLVGVPLEMVHGATRIGLVYVAGVVAGSLAVSVADMTAPVVGSSGGVYALVSAHLANIVMNWSGMKCQFKLLRMAVALICTRHTAAQSLCQWTDEEMRPGWSVATEVPGPLDRAVPFLGSSSRAPLDIQMTVQTPPLERPCLTPQRMPCLVPNMDFLLSFFASCLYLNEIAL